MNHSSTNGLRHNAAAALGLGVLAVAVTACGGGTVRGSGTVTESEWPALAAPRPAPLPGAVRLSLTNLELLGAPPWELEATVPLSLGLAELTVAGLLRRRDIHFVERRRFAAAVAAERTGGGRPAGAPAAGTSPGAELGASVVWVPLGAGQASVDVRLTDARTGAVVAAHRALVPSDADPVGLARRVVAAILEELEELGRLPDWLDPIAAAAPSEYAASGIPLDAVEDFLVGLRAEEAWSWDRAREAYQVATGSVGFFEATVALARTARLRLGGTLGES